MKPQRKGRSIFSQIRIEFEGQAYTVGMEAYDADKFQLPDGRVLKVVGGWSESAPPKPNGLEVMEMEQATADVARLTAE